IVDIRQPPDTRRIGTSHAARDADGDSRGSTRGHVARFVACQLGDARANPRLQFKDVDEGFPARPHRVEHHGRHARTAKAGERRGRVDDPTYAEVGVAGSHTEPTFSGTSTLSERVDSASRSMAERSRLTTW